MDELEEVEEREAEIDRQIIDGYLLLPQVPDPRGELAARASIAAEPW